MAEEAKELYNEQLKAYKGKRKEDDDAEDTGDVEKRAKPSKKGHDEGKKKSSASTSKSSPSKTAKSAEFVATDDDTTSSSDNEKPTKPSKNRKVLYPNAYKNHW